VWTPQKQQAFELYYANDDSRRTQAQVAAEVGVTRRTIEGWARRREWRWMAAKREAELMHRYEVEEADWREERERQRAERRRIQDEHLADFQRQLHERAAADLAR
jgi:hypothetical protein